MFLSRRLLTAFLAPLLGLMLIGAPARAVEEPAFRLELKDGAFEIRDYPELVVAEVTVDGDQNTAGDRGFRILARYIFGANHGQRHIAMTAPVSLTPPGEKIAMTAPVSQTRAGEAWTVRFTMPSAWRMDTLPQPNDSRISLHTVPPVRMAVLRFSGRANAGLTAQRTAELLSLVQNRGLRPVGPVSLAQYDPPWILGFARRNEVMAAVAP
jgi:hypothetical protein